MIDLSLQAEVLLLAQLELQVDNLFLLAKIRYNGSKFTELGVGIVSAIGIVDRSGRICSLTNARCLRADRLQVLVEEVVLCGKVFASGDISISE